MLGGGAINKLLQDLRYSVRTLLKNPGFALIAIVTLALGIGANTAIFSVVNAVLLRPLNYTDPEQLVLVTDTQPPSNETPADYAEYLDWREQAQVFQHLAAYFNTTFTLTGHGDPQQLWGARISANTLPALGINPILGRGFRQEEEVRGSERVALISYGFWQRQFAGDPKVVGQSITNGLSANRNCSRTRGSPRAYALDGQLAFPGDCYRRNNVHRSPGFIDCRRLARLLYSSLARHEGRSAGGTAI
jgi:hypothetical protein